MPLQKKNPDLVAMLATYFPELDDPGFAWPRMVGASLGLPRVRAYWPFTSIDENGNAYDISGQARTLTNNAGATFDRDGLRVYTVLNGSSQYYSRASETGLEFGGGSFFFAGWFYFGRSAGTLEYLLSKGTPGTNGYHIRRSAGNVLEFVVDTKVFTTTLSPTTSEWGYVAARLNGSTEMAVWLNGDQQLNTTSIPASPTTNLSATCIGRQSNAASSYFQGNVCQCVICGFIVTDVLVTSHFEQTCAVFGL